jgi:hypothetical protein
VILIALCSVTDLIYRHRPKTGTFARKSQFTSPPSHLLITFSQNCYPWEIVRPSCFIDFTSLISGKCWCRYSNTLLVSLNNRISIREASTRQEAVSRTRSVTFHSTDLPRAAAETVHIELEKPPRALSGWTHLGAGQSQERVIGEWCNSFSPPGFVRPSS